MKLTKIGNIHGGQDGAIWNNFLFRFDADGACYVYSMENNVISFVSEFTLGNSEIIVPHSNAVSFSCEYYCKGDEFPLLFTNVYNNYSKMADRREGVCCVYRLTREGCAFSGELVGTVEIGFVHDKSLWCSENASDVRPYGNFAVDRENRRLFAFTMRDETKTTRYFSFKLPHIMNVPVNPVTGLRRLVLMPSDIEYYFDCVYQHYLQGACVYNGIIYSLEGFTNDEGNPPVIRLISSQKRAKLAEIQLRDYGTFIETEFIDSYNNLCYYSDNYGNLYNVSFDE